VFSLLTTAGCCSHGLIVSAYNNLQNIDVASRIFMREIILHSFFQCLQSFVKALDIPADI